MPANGFNQRVKGFYGPPFKNGARVCARPFLRARFSRAHFCVRVSALAFQRARFSRSRFCAYVFARTFLRARFFARAVYALALFAPAFSTFQKWCARFRCAVSEEAI